MVRKNYRELQFNYYPFKPRATGMVREYVVSDLGPSCIGFDLREGKVYPIFDDNDLGKRHSYVMEIMHESAITFINDYQKEYDLISTYLVFNNIELSLPFEAYLCKMSSCDQRIFQGAMFEDKVWGNVEQLPVNGAIDHNVITVGKKGEYVGRNIMEIMRYNNRFFRYFVSYFVDRNMLAETLAKELCDRKFLLRIGSKIWNEMRKRGGNK